MDNTERYSLIKTAMESALAEGVRLINGDWGISSDGGTYNFAAYAEGSDVKCGCAIGCLLASQNVKCESAGKWLTDRVVDDAAKLLDTDEGWINSFVLGFDGESPEHMEPGQELSPEAYTLGKTMRHEFLPLLQSSDDLAESIYNDLTAFEDSIYNQEDN